MSSANSDSFTFFFPTWVSFISLLCLIAVTSTLDTINMLNKSGEIGHPCLFPDLRGKTFRFSPLSIILAVGLSYMAFIMLGYVPSLPTLLRIVIISGC